MSVLEVLKKKADDVLEEGKRRAGALLADTSLSEFVGVEVLVAERALLLSREHTETAVRESVAASKAPISSCQVKEDRLVFVVDGPHGVRGRGEIVEIGLALHDHTWQVTAQLADVINVSHDHRVIDAVVRVLAGLLRAAPDAFGSGVLKQTSLELSCGRVDDGLLGALAGLADEAAGIVRASVTFTGGRLRLRLLEPDVTSLRVPQVALGRLALEIVTSRLR